MKYKDLAGRLEPALRRIRRGRRKLWTNGVRCHIELRELSGDELRALAPALERALAGRPGVAWARVNPYIGRVVAQYDGTLQVPDELVREVELVEARMGLSDHAFPVRDPEQHPGDAAPIRRLAIELGAEIASLLAGSVLGRVGFQPWAPGIDLAALLRAVETIPALRKAVERAVSIASTELGLELGLALAQTLLQGTAGSVAGILHLSLRMRELVARRRLWDACEPELCADPAAQPGGEATPREPRPRPRQQGPVEQYTDRASAASLGLFGLAFLGTRSLESASGAIFAGVPWQAQHGRDAFAAHFAVRLARAGVLVLDPHVLRKLERLDTVVMTAELLGAADARARELVAAVRRAGLRLVVAESAGDEAAWASPDERSASTARDVVRALQAQERRVCFLSCRASPALAEADCGLGLCVAGARPPWGAHVLCRSGVVDAVFVLDGVAAARRASRQSVRLSMAEAGLGALFAFSGLDRATTRRIMAAASATSILSMANAEARPGVGEARPGVAATLPGLRGSPARHRQGPARRRTKPGQASAKPDQASEEARPGIGEARSAGGGGPVGRRAMPAHASEEAWPGGRGSLARRRPTPKNPRANSWPGTPRGESRARVQGGGPGESRSSSGESVAGVQGGAGDAERGSVGDSPGGRGCQRKTKRRWPPAAFGAAGRARRPPGGARVGSAGSSPGAQRAA